jgi:hypothetical protein
MNMTLFLLPPLQCFPEADLSVVLFFAPGMIALRPVYPIFEQGYSVDIPSFKEPLSKSNIQNSRAICQLDLRTCEALFDYKSAVRYGFGGRPLAQQWEERIRNNNTGANGTDLLALDNGVDTNGSRNITTISYFDTPMPSLAAVFDTKKIHAYFLSGGKKDRIEGCLKIVKSFGLEERHYDFISGPTSISNTEISDFRNNGSLVPFNRSKSYKWSKGIFLCQLGILRVMKAFLASEHEEMILFEDDVAVPGEYNLRDTVEYARLMLSIPTEEYDMQYLGYCFECVRPVDKVRLGFHSRKPFYYTQALMPLCNHAVLLKRNAVKVFVELTTPFNRPGDISLAHATCSTGMMIIRHII